jgi:hypothetical protein
MMRELNYLQAKTGKSFSCLTTDEMEAETGSKSIETIY